ncbi:MAG: prepilin-type N-terminal cleavage/methylation domain-containing protein [Candidatus Omnitrophota bacterium]|jgi:prepilin-type N-terminal cleavage/methylation domain-containing protein
MLSKRGFSLVEFLIGVAIVLIVLVGSLLAFVQLMLLNEGSSNLVIAANDAQYVLEQMKNEAFEDLASHPIPTFNNLNSETVTLTRSIGVNIATVTADVSWQERGNARNFSISTCFARE